MPKVTDIQKQKKRTNRYSIFVDGQYSFSLGDLEFSLSGLEIGQELTKAQVLEYRQQSSMAKLTDRALHYLSFRPRSVQETRRHLSLKGFSDAEIEPVLAKLESKGFLNDQAFASSWIANRQLLKPKSRKQLVQELRQKGVSSNDIEAALLELGPEDELTAIRAIMAKKRSKYQDPRQLSAYLANLGFSWDQIKEALSEYQDS